MEYFDTSSSSNYIFWCELEGQNLALEKASSQSSPGPGGGGGGAL